MRLVEDVQWVATSIDNTGYALAYAGNSLYCVTDKSEHVICEFARLAPAVDAAPIKRGKWFDVGSLSCRCDNCGNKSNMEYPYCPYCGAKMEQRG